MGVKAPAIDLSKAGITGRVTKTEQKPYEATIDGKKEMKDGLFIHMENWEHPVRYAWSFGEDGNVSPSGALAKFLQRLQKLGLLSEGQVKTGGWDLDEILVNKTFIWNKEQPWQNKKGTGLDTQITLPTAIVEAHEGDTVAPTTGPGTTESVVNRLVQAGVDAGKPLSPNDVLNALAQPENGGGSAVEQWISGGLQTRMLQTSLELRSDKLYPKTAVAPKAA